jgi:integrase
MSVQRHGKGWRVRWKNPDGSFGSNTLSLKRDAVAYDAEVKRRKRLGQLADLDAGTESLNDYVASVWAPSFGAMLAPKARKLYSGLYDTHLSPTLGSVPLREIRPELISRWQADRLAAGAGPTAVAKSLTLLGNILQRAVESGRIPTNPQRLVRRAPLPRRSEVKPLPPRVVEKLRAASTPRDSMLISILAYSGLRPGEALALRWGDVRERFCPAPGPTRPGSGRVAAALRPSRRRRADLPWRGRPAVV